ncbi:MAG TPA: hypothetical protein PLB91_06900 [Spirochaetales bacterium]|nr:hypothetical protein [Spirochaetales bacterium]HRY52990.1 hypothetical protein [Spirochaetia bacterium]
MKILVNLDRGVLTTEGLEAPVSCDVRNELNGRRGVNEVVFTLPGGRPYYPRRFPRGTWQVLDIRARSDPYRAPFFIATDANQLVDEWSTVEIDGVPQYDKPTGRKVVDKEYGLHYSTSPTTTGCIKIINRADLLTLVELIRAAWKRSEVVNLEVS